MSVLHFLRAGKGHRWEKYPSLNKISINVRVSNPLALPWAVKMVNENIKHIENIIININMKDESL